jgi:hypothetical protein
VGTSKITGTFWKAFRLGMRMILMVVHYRFKRIPCAPQTQGRPVMAKGMPAIERANIR